MSTPQAREPGAGPQAYARRGDRATSHMAAQSISGARLSRVQQAVGLTLSRLGPLTDEQLIAAYRDLQSKGIALPPATDSSIRTRRKELVDMGAVVDRGTTKTTSGRVATLWSTVKGRRAA